MTDNALQNLDLNTINDISFSQIDSGEILTEVFIQPKTVAQGTGTAPRFIVDGLDIRLSDSDEVEVHDLYQDGIAHNAYIQYLNYVEHDDGSCDYDGIRALIFEQEHLSPNDEDAKNVYDFSSLRDALLFLKENYKTITNRPSPFGATPAGRGNGSRIKDPLSTVFGRKD